MPCTLRYQWHRKEVQVSHTSCATGISGCQVCIRLLLGSKWRVYLRQRWGVEPKTFNHFLCHRYLGVRGMRPLLDSEWQVYSEAALEEWSQKRGAHESALRAVGHSAFFNSRVRHSSLDIRV
eukprot:1019051-Pelagomonas_calceolata.AAC.10